MQIHFRKHFGYDVPHDRITARALLLGQVDPPPCVIPREMVLPTYVSPSLRARDSVTGEYVRVIPALREVAFDLGTGSLHVSSVEVRTAFLAHWYADTLETTREQLRHELEEILLLVRNCSCSSIFISHSFRLSLLEAYLELGERLFAFPELLSRFISPDRRTFAFGEGFDVDLPQLRMIGRTDNLKGL